MNSLRVAKALESEAKLRTKAMDFLSMRDYGFLELKKKLMPYAKNLDEASLLRVLERLKKEGLQSDERFIEMSIQSFLRRGKGSLYMAQALKQKELPQVLINQNLAPIKKRGLEDAFLALEKRFSMSQFQNQNAQKIDIKDLAKFQRFLLSRGFDFYETKSAISKFIQKFNNQRVNT